MSRTRRSAFSVVTGALLSLVTMVVGLVAARLLVKWLGDKTLGTYTAAAGWMGQIAILEIGIASAVPPVLAKAAGLGDATQLRSALAAAFKVYFRIAALSVLTGVVLIAAITKLMAVPPGDVFDVRMGMAIGLVGCLFLPFNPLRSLLDASQRSYAVNIILILQSLGITALSLLFAWAGWGVSGQFLAAFIGSLMFLLLVTRGVRKIVPGFGQLFFQPANPLVSDELRNLNRPALIVGIAGRLGLLTDNLVIAYFFGPALVVPFFFAQKLSLVVLTQLQNIGGSTWAALTELHVQGHRDLLAARMVQLTRLISTVGLISIVPIVAYNRVFFALWQPRLKWPGETLTVLASVNSVMWSVLTLWGWVFNGTGRVGKLVPLSICAVIINVSVSVAAAEWGVIYGPVLGTTICLAGVQLWWMLLLMRNEFEIAPAKLLGALTAPAAIALPYAALILYLAHRFMPTYWLALGLEMAGAGAGLALIYFVLLLDAATRRALFTRSRSIFSRTALSPLPLSHSAAVAIPAIAEDVLAITNKSKEPD